MNNTINKHAEILKSCEPKCNKSVFWTHKQCFPLFLLTHIKKKKVLMFAHIFDADW